MFSDLVILSILAFIAFNNDFFKLVVGLYSFFLLKKYLGKWISNWRQHSHFYNTKLGVSRSTFHKTPISYRSVEIPKKTGGNRTLRIPNKELKSLQKKIDKFFRKELAHRIHPNAYAFRRNRSVVSNASVHCNQQVIVKLDIKNFFENVPRLEIIRLVEVLPFSNRVKSRIVELCVTDMGLPQGAPTSPFLSNAVLYSLDSSLFQFALSIDARYTRYADDITFSLAKDDSKLIKGIIQQVKQELASRGYKLNLKRSKLHVLRPHQSQRICGITINSGVPTISRKKRRQLRAIKHNLEKGTKATLTKNQLEGWESYIAYINSFDSLTLRKTFLKSWMQENTR